jgi:hypothetical protein
MTALPEPSCGDESSARIAAAKARIAGHVAAAEAALLNGTLGEIIKETPSVEEQFRSFLDRGYLQ